MENNEKDWKHLGFSYDVLEPLWRINRREVERLVLMVKDDMITASRTAS